MHIFDPHDGMLPALSAFGTDPYPEMYVLPMSSVESDDISQCADRRLQEVFSVRYNHICRRSTIIDALKLECSHYKS